MFKPINEVHIAIIGLGYVGLPLAVEFGKKYPTIGFDINGARISELHDGIDNTLEVESEELSASTQLTFSSDAESLKRANVYIVTVPTPIDEDKQPDLTPLIKASQAVGNVLKSGDLVIYESTVYPGATEDVCIPILERESDLIFNKDFYCGYSPERINPGDKKHRLTTILKVTSGSTLEVSDFVDSLYRSIITAGTYKASSIKVAEAAKVIENTQRDLNIALVNELAIIFNKLGIDTEEVLEAAGTKWNFLPFRPGLVGGHCIGVDPYYLTYKAQQTGYFPDVILAGRRINNGMGAHIATQLVKAMLKKRIHVEASRILVMGASFKENCPDVRNSKVIDVVRELTDYGAHIELYDPWVSVEEVEREYGIKPISTPVVGAYDAIVLAVAHQAFADMGEKGIRELGKKEHVLYDLKYVLPKDAANLRL